MPEAPNAAANGAAPPADTSQLAQRLLKDIASAEAYLQNFHIRSEKIAKIYAEARPESATTFAQRRFPILWANMEVLKPAVYAHQPQPVVKRRFPDRDPAGRAAAEVTERCLTTTFDLSDIDGCLRSVRDDFLLVGRGSAWARYEVTLAPAPEDQSTSPQEGEDGAGSLNGLDDYGGEEDASEVEAPAEVITGETVCFDYVHWRDLIYPRCRRWADLPWLARAVWMDYERVEERFGRDLAKAIKAKSGMAPISASTIPDPAAAGRDRDLCCIYEIWSKVKQRVYWVAKDYGESVLDEGPPMYQLQGFYPCPRPAFATLLTDSLIPQPDYVYYQDQAEEINRLTARMDALLDALKLVGFYPAAGEGGVATSIEAAMNPNSSNLLIPIPSWAAFTEGGKSAGLIEWLPVDMVQKVLAGVIQSRAQLIADVFQITGISDILRGSTDPNETATAQGIKAQWGGIRIRDRQAEMARFARDLSRIAAEIMAEHFQPETLWELSDLTYPTEAEKMQAMAQQAQAQLAQPNAQGGQPQPGQPQQALPPPDGAQGQPTAVPDSGKAKKGDIANEPTQEAIMALLRDDKLRSYRIDIETDSTVEADEQAEKENRTEFLNAVGAFMQTALPAAQAAPQLLPALGEMLMFVVRGYRAGRQLEDVIEQSVQDLVASSGSASQEAQQPDPQVQLDQAKMQSENQYREADLTLKKQDQDARIGLDQKKFETDVAFRNSDRQLQGLPPVTNLPEMPSQVQSGQQTMQAIQMLAQAIGQAFQGLQQSQEQQIAMLAQKIDQGSQATMASMALMRQMADGINAMSAYLTAPVEIIRDGDGKIVGVSRGQTTQMVTRNPDGSVAGVQ